jgi:ATP-dependent DNA helicase RecG
MGSPHPQQSLGEVIMVEDVLLNLLKSGESETVEFKTAFDKEVIETAAAFANTSGGLIFIGVDDEGKIKGVQIGKETLNDWANKISQSTEPRIIPEIALHELDGKAVVVIQAKEFPIKPSVKGRYFRRAGSSNRMMTPQEVAEMHLNSTGTSLDTFPATNATIDDIDTEKVDRYIRKANTASRRKIKAEDDPLKVLEKLELAKDKRPTLAAIILFGKALQEKWSQATVHCGRFKQETMIIDDKLVGGTAIEQIAEVELPRFY